MGSKFLFRGKHLKPTTSDSSYDGSETSTVHSADTVMVSETEPSYNWTASDSKNTTKSKTHCCFKKFLHKFVGKFFPGVNIGVSGKLLKSHLKYLKRRGKASRNLTRTYLSEYFDTNFTESNNQTLEEQHFKYKSQNSKCIWKKFKCYVKNVFTKVHGYIMSFRKRGKGTAKVNGTVTRNGTVRSSYNTSEPCQCAQCVAYRLRLQQQEQAKRKTV